MALHGNRSGHQSFRKTLATHSSATRKGRMRKGVEKGGSILSLERFSSRTDLDVSDSRKVIEENTSKRKTEFSVVEGA